MDEFCFDAGDVSSMMSLVDVEVREIIGGMIFEDIAGSQRITQNRRLNPFWIPTITRR